MKLRTIKVVKKKYIPGFGWLSSKALANVGPPAQWKNNGGEVIITHPLAKGLIGCWVMNERKK